MSWIKAMIFGLTAISLEFALFLNMPNGWYYSNDHIAFFIIYQVFLILSLRLLYLERFQTLAISVLLLLTANFFTIGIQLDNDFKTLKPNFLRKIKIQGEVMPNFDGVNTISTDEKGFRSSTDIDYSYDGTYRIFAIGASTTEEIFVDDNETWTSLISEKISLTRKEKVEVINTGVSGLRAQHHLSTMLGTEKYHPDAYIFLMGVNDWNQHIIDFYSTSAISISDNDVSKSLIWRGVKVLKKLIRNRSSRDNQTFEVKEEYGEYYSKQNNSLAKEDVRNFNPQNIDHSYNQYVIKIATRCKAKEYNCLFVTQPSAYSTAITKKLRQLLWMTPPNVDYTLDLESLIKISSLYNSELKRIAADYDVSVCNLAKEIPPTEDYFYDDVHFNENGSKKVAEIIHECTESAFRK